MLYFVTSGDLISLNFVREVFFRSSAPRTAFAIAVNLDVNHKFMIKLVTRLCQLLHNFFCLFWRRQIVAQLKRWNFKEFWVCGGDFCYQSFISIMISFINNAFDVAYEILVKSYLIKSIWNLILHVFFCCVVKIEYWPSSHPCIEDRSK